MNEKLLTRDEFREAVFKRDGYKCIFCSEKAQDAHHILERRLWGASAGYYLSNGASVCAVHHLDCEKTLITVEEVREKAGILKPMLPEHFYSDLIYTKWGDVVLANGQRTKGELFYDESVQKILKEAGVLHLYTDYVKYPRTYHLPFSPGMNDDDRALKDCSQFEGKQVVVTEKLDGECLLSSMKITMADNSKRNIGDLVRHKMIGSYVMGVSESGQIIPSKILNVFYNGNTENWVSVNIKGPHSKYQSIRCTSNHNLFANGKYIEANKLRSGDIVQLLENSLELTSFQEEILLGKLLGDGSLHFPSKNKVKDNCKALIQFGHKKGHKEYIEWTNKCLGDIAAGICSYTSGFGTDMLKSSTRCTNAIYNNFHSMIKNGKKIVPEWVIDKASAITLAFWYMDDGDLSHNTTQFQRDRIKFSVCGFDVESCKILQTVLLKFGIYSKLKRYRGYLYIVLSANDTEKFSALIGKFIPQVMQYKLPEFYRDVTLINPPNYLNKQISRLRNVEVVNVVPYLHNTNRGKYDIETETHNYFANDILVHNCTTIYPDYIHARSIDGRSHPTRDWVKNFWSTIKFDIPSHYRICGENLFAKHSILYDNLETYFYGFSIWNDRNICLSWDETLEWFSLLGITSVPVLYHGIWNESLIKQLYNEKTMWSKQEGYVVRIADSFSYFQFKNSVAKYVRSSHVQTAQHNWMNISNMEQNKLKEK